MKIKFRGKRIDNNEWVYGFYVEDPSGKHRIYYKPFEEATSNTYHFVSANSISQFTGFMSKDKKEVYQYDIVNFGNSLYTYFIIFSEGSFMCLHTKIFGVLKEHLRWGLLSRADELGWDIEIIGNTLDNSELLAR